MGASARQLLTGTALAVKDVFIQERERIKSTDSLAQAKRRWQKKTTRTIGGAHRSRRLGGRLSTYRRRTIVQNPRRSSPENGMGRRVITLKKLIPNGETMGIDGLFKETADYILALEMRVKVMQVMVNLLGASGSEF